MKNCPRCKTEKPLIEFYQRRGKEGGSVYCKPCTNEQTLERQRNVKQQALEYKGGKCSICGYNKCQAALQFHHIDPIQKDFSISGHKCMSFNTIKPELDKCILVCSNCHAEIHFKG